MPKKSFAEQVIKNEPTVQKQENVVKSFSTNTRGKKILKRTCVLVDPGTWSEFKTLCSERYGITASAQINLFINQFIIEEKRRIKEENE